MFISRTSSRTIFALLVILSLLISNQSMAAGDEAAAKLAWSMIDSGVLLIDVRTAEEFDKDHIDGAVNIDWDKFDALSAAIGDDKQRSVVLYCHSGNRSGKAIAGLTSRGYTNLYNATGLGALNATKPDRQ